ncbi:hypothetical protein D3C85_1856340 [compost metagenome]
MSEARAAVEPTDKSISPVLITKVIAAPIIEIMAVWRMMFSRLPTVRNPSLYKLIEK